MAEMTKAQLEERLAEEQRIREELEQKVASLDKQTKQQANSSSGWLIQTPNPLFNGRIKGVLFENGQAYILENGDYPQFDVPKSKLTQLENYVRGQYPSPPYTKEQQDKYLKEIIDRDANTTTAQRATQFFQDDFGYTVRYYGPEERGLVQDRMNDRIQQAARERAAQESLDQAHQLIPGYKGG